MKRILLVILGFYQKFITIFSFGSCRYHPTCSEYAMWQFENNNILYAFYHSLIRILKCNQLFDGGFDYPFIKKVDSFLYLNSNIKKNKISDIKYWYIPISDSRKINNYIIIKNWGFKNGN